MDLHEKLRENKRRLENREIDEDEFNKCKNSLLEKWTNESKKTKEIKPNRGKITKKSIYLTPFHTYIANFS
jgi:hypothetical protein